MRLTGMAAPTYISPLLVRRKAFNLTLTDFVAVLLPQGSRKARTTVVFPFTSLIVPSQSCSPWVTSKPTRVTAGTVVMAEIGEL